MGLWSRILLLASAVILVATSSMAKTPDEKPVVAVFTIEDTRARRKRLKPKKLENLTNYLSAQLTQGGHYKVVPQQQLRALLLEKKAESYRKCYSEKCQIEIGRELAAEKTLSTRIMQVGSKCVVTSTLYNLRESASEKAATHKGACSEDAIVEAIEKIAVQLKSEKSTVSSGNVAMELYKAGKAAYEKRDKSVALTRLHQAAERSDDWKLTNDIHWHLGQTYRDIAKNDDKALVYYENSEEVSQDKSDWPAYWAIYMQGVIAFERNQPQQAIAKFREAERYGTAEWKFMNDLYYHWALTYRDRMHDSDKALAYCIKCEAASQEKSDWPAYWAIYLQGVIAFERNQPQQAIAKFREAERYGTAEWKFMNDLYYHWALTYRDRMHDSDKALEYCIKCEAASQVKSDWPAYWAIYLQGVIAHEKKQPQQAIAKYREAERHGTAEWKFMNDLYWYWGATCRDLLNDNDKALVYYKKCEDVSQDKSDWPAYWAIALQGIIAKERGQKKKSKALFSRARKFGKHEKGFLQFLSEH